MFQQLGFMPTAHPAGTGYKPSNFIFRLPSTHAVSAGKSGDCEPDHSADADVQKAGACDTVTEPSRSQEDHVPNDLPVGSVLRVKPNRFTRRHVRSYGVDLSGDGFLRLTEVLSVYPVSRAAWYEGMSNGIYPSSIPLGKRSVGWTRESIRQLIANPPVF